MRKRYLNFLLGALLGGLSFCFAAEIASNQVADKSMPPMPPSPIEDFRRWLLQTPSQQMASLASRTPEQRSYLIAKLREYSALTVSEREAKLQALDLTWYLRPLMDVVPAQRVVTLSRIPLKYREIVQDRLRQWDALPRELQKDVLENEWTIHYFMRFNADPQQRQELLRKADPTQRKAIEEKLARWEALSPDRRDRMYQQFNRFFQLPQTERARTLNVMSESERNEMEGTLKAFEKLAPEQRKVCIESFEKFTSMRPEERREFLRDAARWQAMPEKERKTWRNLVNALPPLPDTTPMPPLPRSQPPNPQIASNATSWVFPIR